MTTRIALLYPGQGSQKPGMGLPWRHTDSWRIVDMASNASNIDVHWLLCNANEDQLKDTQNSQLAILTVSLMALDQADRTGLFNNREIIGHAGHSLGEYSALAAAGALSWTEVIQLVAARGAAMRIAGTIEAGSMVAVGGIDEKSVESILSRVESCWMANDNGAGQFVISGRPESTDKFAAIAREAGATLVTVLPVGGAFHSPLMYTAAEPLAQALANVRFEPARAPVYSNVDASPHIEPDGFAQLLLRQLTAPVRWRHIYASLASNSDVAIELGPGRVLTRLGRRDHPDLSRLTISRPGDVTKALAAVEAVRS